MTSGAWNKYSFSRAAKGKKKKKKEKEKKEEERLDYHDLSETRLSKYL